MSGNINSTTSSSPSSPKRMWKRRRRRGTHPKKHPPMGLGSWGGHNGAPSIIRKLRSVKKGWTIGVGKGLVWSLWRSPDTGKNRKKTTIFHKKNWGKYDCTGTLYSLYNWGRLIFNSKCVRNAHVWSPLDDHHMSTKKTLVIRSDFTLPLLSSKGFFPHVLSDPITTPACMGWIIQAKNDVVDNTLFPNKQASISRCVWSSKPLF